MNARLRENERILKEGKANYFNSRMGMVGNSAGGKLYLTNQRMLFEGHGFNAGREAVVIQVKDIVSCSTGFPNTLTILTENNNEFKFAVSGKNDWKNMIMSISTAPTNSPMAMEQYSSDYVKNSHVELSKDKSMEPSGDYNSVNDKSYEMKTSDEGFSQKPEEDGLTSFGKKFLIIAPLVACIIITVKIAINSENNSVNKQTITDNTSVNNEGSFTNEDKAESEGKDTKYDEKDKEEPPYLEDLEEYSYEDSIYYVGEFYVGEKIQTHGECKSSDESIAKPYKVIEFVGEGECTIEVHEEDTWNGERYRLNLKEGALEVTGGEREFNITVEEGFRRRRDYHNGIYDGGTYYVGEVIDIIRESGKVSISDEDVARESIGIELIEEGTCVITTYNKFGEEINHSITVKART